MADLAALASKKQLDGKDRARIASAAGDALGVALYPASLVTAEGCIFGVGRDEALERKAVVLSMPDAAPAVKADKEAETGGLKAVCGAADFENACAFQKALPFLKPVLLGVVRTGGMGDRLGLATPGHVQATRDNRGVRPVFAQQSIREMGRTGRSPKDVMADAVFGALQEGWTDGFGSDADHLKTTDDIDVCLEAGFTMYTVDPGAHVENEADGMSGAELREKAAELPWDVLEGSLDNTVSRLARAASLPGDVKLEPSEEDVVRAAVKYGRAVAHVVRMYRHLLDRAGRGNFELEMSVDETESPTSVFEHFYVASEMKRLGVEWVSLAPRFVGRFEKGVDYIGDLEEFRRSFKGHVAVMRELGPYKMSIHSGSDKFSVYPVVAEEAEECVHLKTAGTSYLAALAALARVQPEFIRRVYAFALERYPEDKATYHVSADLSKVPKPEGVKAEDFADLIGEFNAREAFHVTFGSVLTMKGDGGYLFRDKLYRLLKEHEKEHLEELRRHLGRHLAPFSA